jgi:iron complex transport system substrate-binding protein
VFADDESTGSLFLDFESVFEAAVDADYWLNIGFFATLADLEAADARFAEFAAFQNGQVYNNDLRTNELGSIDFYESGAANPHLVLADLVKIFHPELVEDHESVYYRIVE